MGTLTGWELCVRGALKKGRRCCGGSGWGSWNTASSQATGQARPRARGGGSSGPGRPPAARLARNAAAQRGAAQRRTAAPRPARRAAPCSALPCCSARRRAGAHSGPAACLVPVLHLLLLLVPVAVPAGCGEGATERVRKMRGRAVVGFWGAAAAARSLAAGDAAASAASAAPGRRGHRAWDTPGVTAALRLLPAPLRRPSGPAAPCALGSGAARASNPTPGPLRPRGAAELLT
jgi:hypothetical protein